MILPTKRVSEDRSLIHVGAEILSLLTEPKTVSRLWHELKRQRNSSNTSPLTYDWFILSLDLLYIMRALDLHKGLIRRNTK